MPKRQTLTLPKDMEHEADTFARRTHFGPAERARGGI